MTTLFVNACLRGDESRTLTLCREYLEDIADVTEINLAELKLEPFYAEQVQRRVDLQSKGNSMTQSLTSPNNSPRQTKLLLVHLTGIYRSRLPSRFTLSMSAYATSRSTTPSRPNALASAKLPA